MLTYSVVSLFAVSMVALAQERAHGPGAESTTYHAGMASILFPTPATTASQCARAAS